MWLSFSIFLVLTVSLSVLYLTLSVRDTWGDLKFVFDRRFFRGTGRLLVRMGLAGAVIVAISYVLALAFKVHVSLLLVGFGLLATLIWGIWMMGPKTIFDWSLVKRSLRQYSLKSMLAVMGLSACFFAMMHWYGGGVDGFVLAAVTLAPIWFAVVMYRTVVQDLSDDDRTRSARRQQLGRQPKQGQRPPSTQGTIEPASSREPIPQIRVYGEERGSLDRRY